MHRACLSGEYPDNCGSKEVLGYFLNYCKQKGVTDFVTAIKFDHGETAEEYMNASKGLLDDVLEQLMLVSLPAVISLDSSDLPGCH